MALTSAPDIRSLAGALAERFRRSMSILTLPSTDVGNPFNNNGELASNGDDPVVDGLVQWTNWEEDGDNSEGWESLLGDATAARRIG